MIHVKKDNLKFSSAHMTVFPDGSKEHLHGHNYQVFLDVDLQDGPLKDMVPFSAIKGLAKQFCDVWDEKILIAKSCPFMKNLETKKGNLSFTLCEKYYSFPKNEVVLLPVDNITTENLSRYFAECFLKELNPKVKKKLQGLVVRIEEFPGQGASFSWRSTK